MMPCINAAVERNLLDLALHECVAFSMPSKGGRTQLAGNVWLRTFSLLEAKRSEVIVVGALSGLCLLILQGRFADYSFNADELFSLAASRAASWQGLFVHWILPDTFPPLYPVLLKVWIARFGTSEVAVRSLSVIFSLLSLVAVALLTWDKSTRARLLTLLFIGCSPAFAIYSQYARSYALMIFLSVVTTGAALMLRRSSESVPAKGRLKLLYLFYGSAVLLSLSHYFGWLFVSIVLARNLFDRCLDWQRVRSLAVFIGIMAWPMLHVFSGSVVDKTQRISWIVHRPISGVWNAFLEATIPLAPEVSFPWSPSATYPWPLVLYTLIAVIALYAIGSRRRLVRLLFPDPLLPLAEPAHECQYIGSNVLLFLLIVMVVDFRTPFGVGRYFTVLLPPMAFLFGNIPDLMSPRQTRLQRWMTSSALGIILMAQLATSHLELSRLALPNVDYKTLSEFMRSTGICGEGCYRQDTNYFFHDALAASPYFEGIQMRKTLLDETLSISGALPFIGYHRDGLAVQLQASNPGVQCWEPQQRAKAAAFLFIDQRSSISPGVNGLIPCRIPNGFRICPGLGMLVASGPSDTWQGLVHSNDGVDRRIGRQA